MKENMAEEAEERDNMAVETDEMSGVGDNEAAAEQAAQNEVENTPEYEAALWKEKYARLSAEFDNYRKRTVREKMDMMNAGGEEVVRALLETLDDMDRALDAMRKTDDMEAVKQGIELIDAKLRGALRGRGLSEIEAMGEELDTDLHEAIARVPASDEAQKGKIIDVVQKGYKLRDKIIRYAKVVVGQ
ncbi:MAG: nucleotide exchange factor GrpE [Alistipes sp.]|jgi:molecular chaperone GrpE|nr:nucleotide exchange factor GrpE [Alistipes sp.]